MYGVAYWDRHSILQSGQPFGHISLGSRGGNYYLAYVRSQMIPHMCAKFGPNRSSRLADFPHSFNY